MFALKPDGASEAAVGPENSSAAVIRTLDTWTLQLGAGSAFQKSRWFLIKGSINFGGSSCSLTW